MSDTQESEVSNETTERTEESTSEAPMEAPLLKEKLMSLEKENTELKENLRSQSKKHKAILEEETKEEAPIKETTELKELKEKVQHVEKIIQNNEQRYKARAIDWLYKQSWGKKYAPDSDTSDKNIAEFNRAFELMQDKFPAVTEEDFKANLKRADILASPVLEELNREGKVMESEQERLVASGASGSTVRRSQLTENLSAEEERFLKIYGAKKS